MSYNGYGQPSGVPDHDHSEISSLRYRVSDLDSQVTNLSDRVDETERALPDLSEKVDDTARDLADAERDVRRLSTRVRWLEGVIRAANLAPAARFEPVPAEWRRLAAKITAGWAAADRLMSDGDRARKKAVVAAVALARDTNKEAAAAVLAAATALGGTGRNDPEHAQAAAAFTAARGRLGTSSQTLNHQHLDAQDFAEELAADDRLRREVAGVIEAGQKAEHGLYTRACTVVAEAVKENALYPGWFADDFGPVAPAGGDRRTYWVGLAAKVLAFRAVYGVDDQSSALGPVGGGGRRAAERSSLARALREIDN